MARKGRRARRPRPRARRRSGNFLRIPFINEVIEGKTSVFSFNSIFGKQGPDSIFKSLPWRVTSVYLEFARSSDINDPGIIQVRLNNALQPNVEGITSRRLMVTPGVVRKINLRARSPNPWKEEEQKTQNILEIDNIKFGTDSVPCKIGVYCVMTFQLANIVWGGYDQLVLRGMQPDLTQSSPFSTMTEEY